ncbi:MAG: class I SAM-dependent methyltransferase [Rhodobacteraceae bacterium]|nr:class I SAM-dependent methyltransferase [Paracoccaceae bacterium]
MTHSFRRRSVMAGTAGLASTAAAFLKGGTADAALPKGTDVEPRGSNGMFERLPSLDLESSEQFLTTLRTFVNREFSRSANRSAAKTIAAKGKDPLADYTHAEAIELLKDDPMVAMRTAMWQRLQMHSWQNLRREFHNNYDAYMSEMDAADNIGPGKLELNANFDYPEHVKHEIHMQPGGYVGDPFAGHLYYYLTMNFQEGRDFQDERHIARAAAVPLPADGKVKRVLELGCGTGRMTMALKNRFPDAEVWGVEVGAPLIRYGHMRAVDRGIDVNFRHGLAEDTKFPDGHFDIVTSYILHHEAPAEISRQIFKEAYRVLRPGGLYFPIDLMTGSSRKRTASATARYSEWIQYRWNHEAFWIEYFDMNMPKEMSAAGFEMHDDAPPGYPNDKANIVGIKPA